MGCYQIRYLDRIPDHAAVSESVDLVKRARKSSAAGMVNAILRRLPTAACGHRGVGRMVTPEVAACIDGCCAFGDSATSGFSCYRRTYSHQSTYLRLNVRYPVR